ncbi:MAG: hypothetical protein E6845_05950 [Clostridium sp.]|uniref:hypothetical protein n=1 Tax=Clostridium TaxID=1485 RepID=UPI000DE98C26|nr:MULTISPECIES: hypothetical protein [Clostridium]AXB84562.1 hypothetical protein DRB99_06165 [Clostridium butyricum]MDU1602489.1 hypothetical protein [Clostridium sp.]MDU4587011.1 hypothetical protein [Clostridium sp.]
MSKSIKKLLFKLFDLCIEASKTCNYFINCDYTASCDSYSVFAYNKENDEQIPVAIAETVSFKNIKNTKIKILKMIEE